MNIKKIIIFTFIFIFYSYTICYADISEVLTKIDSIGNMFLYIVKRIGKWIVIIMCIMEIIKCAFNYNRNGVGQVIITGGIIYGAIHFVPYMMTLIEEVFK